MPTQMLAFRLDQLFFVVVSTALVYQRVDLVCERPGIIAVASPTTTYQAP